MATFGDIQTAVSKRLLDPQNTSVSLSDVANSINDAIRYWKFRRFYFNEVADSVTLTEQDPVIPMIGDYLVSTQDDDGFNIEYSNQRYPLRKISQQVFDAIYLTNGYGIPQFYCRVADEYQLYPLPDRAYTLNRHYLKDYADLVNTSDENDFTIYAERLITLQACQDLTFELRQDTKMGDYYKLRVDDEYRNLRVMGNKANGAGKLTLHSKLI